MISPQGVPLVTDEQQAAADPELAVLSAMAHGADADHDTAVRIALAAQSGSLGLDAIGRGCTVTSSSIPSPTLQGLHS